MNTGKRERERRENKLKTILSEDKSDIFRLINICDVT
jgi:hypothetical protein